MRRHIGELGQTFVGELEIAGALREVELRLAPRGDVDNCRKHDGPLCRVDRRQGDLHRDSVPSLRVPYKSRPAPIGRLLG